MPAHHGSRVRYGLSVLALAAVLATGSPLWAAKAILYAGSYTSGTSRGIYAWRFDSADASLEPLGLVAETPQPAHIWGSPDGRYLYAVNWLENGGVSAFRIDPETGGLTFLNQVSSMGIRPNQVMVDPGGRIAVTVNYNSGNMAAYTIGADGRLSDPFYTVRHEGRPLAPNQSGPKAHGIIFSPDGNFLHIAELGLDRIYTYRVDAGGERITPAIPSYANTHAGAGPRRLQISHDGKFLYVNHETDSEVSVFAFDGTALKELQQISTLPADYSDRNTTAEIILSPDGRHLYVSNRGHDSIAIFAVDRKSGRLTQAGHVAAGGRTPRNLRLDPTGTYLFSSNEKEGTITLFKVDKRSGLLTRAAAQAEIDTPGGLYLVPSR